MKTKTTLAAAKPVSRPLTLEALFQEKVFEVATLREPRWMQDSKRFSYLDRAANTDVMTVWIYDTATGKRAPVVEANRLRLSKADRPRTTEGTAEPEEDEDDASNKNNSLRITGYQWSPDETRLLFARRPRPHAGGDAALYVYTLATRALKRLTRAEQEHRNAKWSPDGKRVGYVRGDDLYALDLESGVEVRLTSSATPPLYNGRFGWVYQEELDLADGWAWSPDGRRIAYFQVDETQVPQINLTNYADLHLKPVETRYPKAGDPNPRIKIGVVPVPEDFTGARPAVPITRWIDLGPDSDIYIARMQWTPQGDLLLQRLPRLQNRLELLKANVQTGKAQVILREEDNAWVDARGDVTFVKGTNQFLWLSERSGYAHLYLYDLNGALLRPLTQGNWDVEALEGVDSTHRMAYFTAARPSARERQLFSVLLDGGGAVVQLSDTPGTHNPLFSPDGAMYLDTYSSRSQAPRTRLHRSSGHAVAIVQENPMTRLAEFKLGGWELTTFQTNDGMTLDAALLKPEDFDPGKRYPVLIHTYGGPGSQLAQNAYGGGGGLEQFLGQKGYLCAMIDGRGSGGRGRDFKKRVYLNLGHWEVFDQIEGARWLGGLPYVDANRIGIWGWSYGGYVASLAALHGAEIFKAAAAVAPVTHWELYDSIYTERYMRRPQDNPKGYLDSAPLTHANKLKGAFLLMHGTADDNVHFQNSARLAAVFQKQNKPFQMMVYPGKHHGMEGVTQHVFATLTDFFAREL